MRSVRLQVRVGRRYAVGRAFIEVEFIELVPFSSVAQADLEGTGEPDLESLRRRTARGARRTRGPRTQGPRTQGQRTTTTLVYRIEFHAA